MKFSQSRGIRPKERGVGGLLLTGIDAERGRRAALGG